jgi:hypothetical protein
MADDTSRKPSLYVETTIVSYLTAWPSTNVIRRGQQEVTKNWWDLSRSSFELYTSQFVIDESAAGDPIAAAARLAILAPIPKLLIGDQVVPLAQRLLAEGALPPKARLDALHLSVACCNGVQYLLTWNCKHLANAILWRKIEATCKAAGYLPPTICTPHELPTGAL